MKRIICAFLLLLLCLSTALAETDYTTLTDAELSALRTASLNELSAINAELARRYYTDHRAAADEPLGRICDLFPDEAFALVVRDACGKFSIQQPITQADLDKVKRISATSRDTYGDIYDLTGIGYLRNLEVINFVDVYLGATLPDVVCTLSRMTDICISSNTSRQCSIPLAVLPDDIGALTNLTQLYIPGTSVSVLPDSICNLTRMTSMTISYTPISKLPENFANLTQLRRLNISYTNITSIPETLWVMQLDTLNMKGLDIK